MTISFSRPQRTFQPGAYVQNRASPRRSWLQADGQLPGQFCIVGCGLGRLRRRKRDDISRNVTLTGATTLCRAGQRAGDRGRSQASSPQQRADVGRVPVTKPTPALSSR